MSHAVRNAIRDALNKATIELEVHARDLRDAQNRLKYELSEHDSALTKVAELKAALDKLG